MTLNLKWVSKALREPPNKNFLSPALLPEKYQCEVRKGHKKQVRGSYKIMDESQWRMLWLQILVEKDGDNAFSHFVMNPVA